MLKAVGKRLLVTPIEEETRILVAGMKPTKFKVFSIGEDVHNVAVGDTVYLDKHFGAEIAHGQEKYLVVDVSTIMAKVVD